MVEDSVEEECFEESELNTAETCLHFHHRLLSFHIAQVQLTQGRVTGEKAEVDEKKTVHWELEHYPRLYPR